MWSRSPHMFGRAAELDRLVAALTAARDGRGGAVFLAGEPGIGKTRLAAAVVGAGLDGAMAVLQGRGSTIGPMVPFRPLTEALLGFLRRSTVRDVAELGPYREVLSHLIPEWATGRAPLASRSTVVLAEALVRFLALAGRGTGCLLVLDDLQDADAESLAIVEYLLDNVAAQPVIVVGTLRAEPSTALDLARAATRRGSAQLLELSRLGRADVCRLAAACLDVPAERLPEPVADRLWAASAGIPFLAEELLYDIAKSGRLVAADDGWRVAGDLDSSVPPGVVHSVTRRIDRLGPQARVLLSLAATIGHRFPLPVVRQAAGCDEQTMLVTLRAGVEAHLVGPDEPAPDWYSFRHPLTADALLAALTPTERAGFARRAAHAVEALHPQLDGEWCPTAAALWLTAGEEARAAHLFATAGRHALLRGAGQSAVALLDRSLALLETAPPERRAEVLDLLLRALGEVGRFDHAAALADLPEQLERAGLSRRRRAALHAQLAQIMSSAGRWQEASAQVDRARALLGPDPSDVDVAAVDAVAAHLALHRPGPDRLQVARVLASRAAAAAERAPLPAVACDAWQLLGILARERDLTEAHDYFERAGRFAEQHELPFQRMYSKVLQAGDACLISGDVTDLEGLRATAFRIGSLALAYELTAVLAQQCVLRGEYQAAAEAAEECLTMALRLKLDRAVPYILVTRTVLAGHQGRRADLDAALDELHRHNYNAPYVRPLCYGLARTFCALLEEDRELAERDLAQAITYDRENPTTFHLVGKSGLALLLGVLADRINWSHYHAVATSAAGTMRWNRHFVLLTKAVLHGRDGHGGEAGAAVAAAQEAGGRYPMARHLGLRLVAEAALADAWGDPVSWLRSAETHFHETGVAAVAGACRRLMRTAGVTVMQRRDGIDQVPAVLRRHGVTVREFEVCQLLVERLGNKSIGGRLQISPRTVEKHVARLLDKTQQHDREALIGYLRAMLSRA